MLNFTNDMLSSNFIGRKKELERLINLCNNQSSSAILVGIKGKRRESFLEKLFLLINFLWIILS